jgi:hypothetical protein
MNWKHTVLCFAACLTLVPSIADAQRRRPPSHAGMPSGLDHRIEIVGFGGYAWAVGRDFYSPALSLSGTADIKSSPYWGVELGFNLVPQGQLQLIYRRQDSDLEFKSGFKSVSTGMATEYYHIGGIGWIPGADLGTTKAYTSFSLGATRYDIKGFDDAWKFSVMFGLGIKAYVHERIGLTLRGSMPMSFFSGGGSIGCGTGGCYTSVGGTGLLQFDVAAGVMILL